MKNQSGTNVIKGNYQIVNPKPPPDPKPGDWGTPSPSAPPPGSEPSQTPPQSSPPQSTPAQGQK